jgi:putative glutamine amidotransferase
VITGTGDYPRTVTRPLIAIPARFTAHASAIRFRGEVLPWALAEAVFQAGGEPLGIHPTEPGDAGERLRFADGLLLPGGGDIDPGRWGGRPHPQVYDVDPQQDGFDLAAATWAFETRTPMLAICRGTQVLTVARGGTLVSHMAEPHVAVTTGVRLVPGSRLAGLLGADELSVSCHHHQEIRDVGQGFTACGTSIVGGTVEAIEAVDERWAIGVQWHPEDSFERDPLQRRLLEAHVEAARAQRSTVPRIPRIT